MIFGFPKHSLVGQRAPEITGETWFNQAAFVEPMQRRIEAGDSVRLPEDVPGGIVLVDFWDYSCVNCVRTFPYLRAWWDRYQEHGFLIIGVHTPEFAFARDAGNVQSAILRYNLNYPVVSDPEYSTWQRYHNNVWPREILVDHQGVVQHDHRGEGGYQVTEQKIQSLIQAVNSEAVFSEPMAPVHERDTPGAVCVPTSPEIYLGTERGMPSDEMPPALHHWSFSGGWEQQAEEIWHTGKEEAGEDDMLVVHYGAAEVFAVMRTRDQQPATLEVRLDGDPVPETKRGRDISYIDGKSVITVQNDRLFEVIHDDRHNEHQLTILTDSNQLSINTFTFGSSCD